ncbi:uncharacterized protein [Chanodichthys erythropterus]|uniref:uncharacterized protein isoform X1 n=1 Tax=Chanodichthys erythropterus TaxID=933992 RepID=UPI00351F007A
MFALSKDKSRERWRTLLTDIHWWLNLLLLLCLVYHSGTGTKSVSGINGGNVTLSCDFDDREISDFSLISRSKIIPVCQEKNCSGRVFKEGSCDIIIKDLIFSDAGRYILRVYYTNDQRELKYHLHIHDEISVETGEQLKMDVLLINADKVERNSSGEWTEVWTRGHGVSSDRLTDRDGNLTISNFTVSDTGTYRVLDSEGEIWITVTVTITESVEKTNNPAQYTVDPLVIGLSLIGALLVLVVLLIVIWIYRRRHNNT